MFSNLKALAKLIEKLEMSRNLKQANNYRDKKEFFAAANLYKEILKINPNAYEIYIQAGNMLKDANNFYESEKYYLSAKNINKNDGDLHLQLGHLYKKMKFFKKARESYVQALSLEPNCEDARKEIEYIDTDILGKGLISLIKKIDSRVPPAFGILAPEQLPKEQEELVQGVSENSVNIKKFGVELNTFWGTRRVVRGVEAIRGFIISDIRLSDVAIFLNGKKIKSEPLKGPYNLEFELDKSRIKKYTFNIWYDFSDLPVGQYSLTIISKGPTDEILDTEIFFVVEAPLIEEDYPKSDAIINLNKNDPRSIEDQINSRSSVVHEAARSNMGVDVKTILVVRPDQLGDMVASVEGIFRIRELFPHAKIVGLLSPANSDLASTLNVFDDIIEIVYKESHYQRTRVLEFDQQLELKERLLPYHFDMAIDLSQSRMSRPLLALSGAKFTYGFKDLDWPRLSASVDDAYVDPQNHQEIATHSTRILTMIDRLGRIMSNTARTIKRNDLDRTVLEKYGIHSNDRYVVLHTGARIVFSRWAHYGALAKKIVEDFGVKVIIFSGGTLHLDGCEDYTKRGNIRIIDGHLSFDEFDTFLSFCSVFVGNDSGPKHLASLRGVPVISIHSARINWSEWGQEHTGVIITRKLPCAGCTVYHDSDECGKDFVCITGITLDEVYQEVGKLIN